ncbi:MAG: IS3 family transposase [Bacteroidales bacterium]|nr:IS3 family transposase [Bacteroidales bacterium]
MARDWAKAIEELRHDGFELQKLLQLKGMARSTYYYHISKQGDDKYAYIRQRINEIFTQHGMRYGYRRVCQQLRNEGCTINHKTVQRLMQDMNLRSMVRRVKYRSYRGEVGRTAPNVLNREFETIRPNHKWATDVTEFKVADSKAYLSPIIDMFNGEIISYTISNRPDLKMVMDMMHSAKRKVKNTEGIILHSVLYALQNL